MKANTYDARRILGTKTYVVYNTVTGTETIPLSRAAARRVLRALGAR
jgi:hypothetical protein